MPASADIEIQSNGADFKQTIQSPLNRTIQDRYLLVFKLPNALQDKSDSYVMTNDLHGINKKSVLWSVVSCTIPHDNIKMLQILYGGAAMSISSHTRTPVDAFKLQFRIDNLYSNYLAMYEWYNLIQDQTKGIFDAHHLTNNNRYDQYATDISVIALDEYNEPIVKWVFKMAFPTDIGDIQLDYTKTDEIMMQVTFAYSFKEVYNLRRDGILTKTSNFS